MELQRGQFVLSLEDGWIKFVAAEHRQVQLNYINRNSPNMFEYQLGEYQVNHVFCHNRMAELLKEMRYELDQLLAEKIQDPKLDLVTYGRGKLIIETIVHLISTE